MTIIFHAVAVALSISFAASAQESIDDLLAAPTPSVPVQGTFRSIYVVQNHSVETINKGVLNLLFSHQFGTLQNGLEGALGLDMACIRIGADYGVTDWIDLGIQRDNNISKPVSGFVKNRLLRQSTDGQVPLSITWLSMGFLDTRSDAGLDYSLTLERRFSSVHQLMLARNFMDKFSIQVAPTLVHRNLVPTSGDDGIALGVGFSGQYSLTPTIALSAEASPMFTGTNRYVNPEFGIGVDIETGGHIFQLRLSNTTWISEDRLYTRTWNAPSLGFNLSRTFKM